MKKEVKRKRVNKNSSNKSYYSKYDTKKIKRRVNEKKKVKVKNTVLLALLLVYIAVLLIVYLKLGTIATLGTAVLLGLVLGFIVLMTKLKGKGKKKVLTILLILVLLCGIAGMGAFGAFVVYIKTVSDPLYAKRSEDLNTKEVSVLYDKDNKVFAKLGSERREKVTYEQLPEVLIDALVATEDSRFFEHNGFDAPRFIKASLGQLVGNKSAGGASTLSMQVVKNIITDREQEKDSGIEGIIRKFEDIYIAIFKLEKNYTKEQIIEFYVNNHYLGGNFYGVEEASQFYFGKSTSELNVSEAAILVGMFKSPTYYRPDTHPDHAADRRKTVLYLMRRHGYITKEEEELANSIPVESLVSNTEVQANPYQGYIDTVTKEIKNKYKVNPYTTSLKVYTNLDRSKQDAVERVLSGEAYNWIDDKVQTGVAVLESATGAIQAIGNGRNIGDRTSTSLSILNFATDIQRQPGSTAKPLFDYGPGMEYNNWSTYTLFDDAPYTYSNGRSIKNWDGGYFGTITLRRALSTSRNIPALKAFQQVDNKKIIEFVTSLGIQPEIENGKIHEAHAIGAFTGVSPLQMAAAYAAFSNGGYYNEPYSVSKIEYRATGKVVEHEANRTKVMSDSTAYMISSVLQDVGLTDGTPKNVACKTGTTNFDEEYMNSLNMPGDAIRDSWVIGYSTKTTIGMWYGYEKTNRDLVQQGYVLHNVPATIQKDRLFRALVNQGAMESDRSAFQQPSSVVKVGVASGSNPPKLAGPGTSAVYEYFKKGTEPTETAYGESTIKGPFGLKATVDKATKKITITWDALDPGEYSKGNFGTFGYNVYLNNKLLTWTDKTSYVGTEFGTYKIVATFKGYSGIKSDGAEITVKDPDEEIEDPSKEIDPTNPKTE